MNLLRLTALFLVALIALPGCGGSDQPAKSKSTTAKPKKSAASDGSAEAGEVASDGDSPKKKFKAVQLGGDDSTASDGSSSPKKKKTIPNEKQAEAVVAALQPFQILLGQWRWITQKKFGGFSKSGEDLEWVWDFKRDKSRPALTAHTDENPYFHQLWLTYEPEDEKFRLIAAAEDGSERTLEGTWAENGEPSEEYDGKKNQRKYKLTLAQTTPEAGEQWQVTFQQLDNNQYLMQVMKKLPAAKQFGPLDALRQQRVGTSFAVADSDNPGPKCIISGGLGSMEVTYKGKKYPVCCSGCAAAFNDDPERWLAKLAEAEAKKKKSEE